ncbi:aminodeoxychorismate synthase component I [Halobacillus yeomjeoni]|uniref:aminodeoxychorismate synthase component I n=1 Tax=Halobacillus yeomjeoni TaxID=311194 RepID=UPI001CD6DB03|nr:aminodeoxychorismate synthase component I [Halobacillus yeomjeoni]MCA0985297.1 aminodeoxychorismate synthase component I [Halobacillus yeomjeoni]
MNPFLLFEFSDKDGNKQPKMFESPLEVLTAHTLDEVEKVFQRAEQALKEGNYVAGYVSYEAAPAFDSAFHVTPGAEWPLVWFGVFNSPISIKREDQPKKAYKVSGWKADGDYNQYQQGIYTIKEAIEKGDTYQVNYTTRLQADFSGDDYSFYRQLAENQQSSYSAYLNMGEHRLLSASPELFFRIDQDTITTKPMKGTARRGRYLNEDKEQKDKLLASDKERSENLMIVDLLRNDLGKISIPGTVRVPRLFEVETYPTVHQMTSTVQGKLPEGTTMLEVFRALFPCGSITGAPKVRTMEYISRLEPSPREVYCGAIGYMTPEHEAVFNVPIRTVMVHSPSGKAVYGTGGGITWDSTSEGEYEEIHTKARLLTEKRPQFQLLETMKLINGEVQSLDRHMKRVEQSAIYFDYKIQIEKVRAEVMKTALTYSEGTFKMRLLIARNNDTTIEVSPLGEISREVVCTLAASPVNEQNPFLYHKTTHREVYNKHRKKGFFSTLLWNTKGELTEFTIGNLVVKQNGKYYTPPVSSGLLAGSYREKLLEDGVIVEKVLYKHELKQFDEIWFINGLRGWLKVVLEGNPLKGD